MALLLFKTNIYIVSSDGDARMKNWPEVITKCSIDYHTQMSWCDQPDSEFLLSTHLSGPHLMGMCPVAAVAQG